MLGLIAQDEAKVVEEVKRAAVLEWVRMKKISWRKGAELLGMTYRDFLSLMAEHKIPTLDYTEGWLEKELAAFVERLLMTANGRYQVFKVNVGEQLMIARRFGARPAVCYGVSRPIRLLW